MNDCFAFLKGELMEIVKTTHKVKCDITGCLNMADFTLKVKKAFFSSSHFCKTCLNEVYNQMGQHLIPKPPQAPFKVKKIKN